MVKEHGQSLEILTRLAEARGLTPLSAPGPMEVLLLNQLKSIPAADFDIAYIEGQVIFHDNWYKRIEYTAHNGKDEEIKALAQVEHKTGMAHHDAVYRIVRGMGD